MSQKAFATANRKWCKRKSYNFSETKAEDVYIESFEHFNIMPKNETTKLLITQAISQLNAIAELLLLLHAK
ncbi:MAG: hypothetical protein M0R40_04045 [Firmicutes bacterium]|nr:hypothetical protein [Bacillota bacterium]